MTDPTRASAPALWEVKTDRRPGRSCPRCGHVRCEWNEGVSTQHKGMSTPEDRTFGGWHSDDLYDPWEEPDV